AEHVEAADLRHAEIDHHQVGLHRLHLRDRLASVRVGDHVVAGPLGEPLDQVENALLVVDDHQQGLWPVHTHSFVSPRSAAFSAASSNGGAIPSPSAASDKRTKAPRACCAASGACHAAGSAAISARSIKATSIAPSPPPFRRLRASSGFSAAATVCPQPVSAAAM